MMNYMDYRQQLRDSQRREELEMERLCQIELDKENAKRDATYAKEQAAREQLHADVMRGRGQQLLALQQKYRNLEIELEVERDAVQREARLAIEEERAAEEAMRAKALRHQQDILRQMHEARERKRLVITNTPHITHTYTHTHTHTNTHTHTHKQARPHAHFLSGWRRR